MKLLMQLVVVMVLMEELVKPSTDGLCCDDDGFNVDCGKGHIWRIGFASECELLNELTAEEAIRF